MKTGVKNSKSSTFSSSLHFLIHDLSIPSLPYPCSSAPSKSRNFSERQEFDSYHSKRNVFLTNSIPKMQKTIQIRVIKSRVPDSILEDLSTNPFWCFMHAKIQQPKLLYSFAYKTWPGKTLSSIQSKSNRNMQNILHTAK